MYDHNKAQQSKNRVHISWDILYILCYLLLVKNVTLLKLSKVKKILGTTIISEVFKIPQFSECTANQGLKWFLLEGKSIFVGLSPSEVDTNGGLNLW